MRSIIDAIVHEGHEIQLHVHPCWAIFDNPDWREKVRLQPRQDDFFGRRESDSVALIERGIDIFREWGIPFPSVFRSGSLQHDDSLYAALARTGIPYSSNVGVAIFDSGDACYKLYSGHHDRHGVREFPVLSFCDWKVGNRRHYKTLTIAGTSFSETCTLLESAQQNGIEQVVILTHPFEYIQSRDIGRLPSRRHAVNQSRLENLCKFIDTNRDRFEPTSLGVAARLASEEKLGQNILLTGNLMQSLSRMCVQQGYDRFGSLALTIAGRDLND